MNEFPGALQLKVGPFTEIGFIEVCRCPQPFNMPSLRELPVHHRDQLSKVMGLVGHFQHLSRDPEATVSV